MSMGMDMFVEDVARVYSLDYDMVSRVCSEWIAAGRDFTTLECRDAFAHHVRSLSTNKRFSIYHCNHIDGSECHEIIDAPDAKDAVCGLSIFREPREKHMDEFLHNLPRDIEGIRNMFWDCDETISIIEWGDAD